MKKRFKARRTLNSSRRSHRGICLKLELDSNLMGNRARRSLRGVVIDYENKHLLLALILTNQLCLQWVPFYLFYLIFFFLFLPES